MLEIKPTVEDRPHWSICTSNRFSRAAGVTRVQLLRWPRSVFLLTGKDGEGTAIELWQRMEWWAYSSGWA